MLYRTLCSNYAKCFPIISDKAENGIDHFWRRNFQILFFNFLCKVSSSSSIFHYRYSSFHFCIFLHFEWPIIVIVWQTHFQACQIFLTILLVHNFTPTGRRLQNAFGIENSSQAFVPNIAQNIFYTAYLCLGNLVDCRAHYSETRSRYVFEVLLVSFNKSRRIVIFWL